MNETTDIEKFERRTPDVPAVAETTDIVLAAINRNLDPALIEKMMDLADRNKAAIAKEAYVKAKANFKKKAPRVIKDKDNKQYNSKYASEDALINTITPYLSEEGLDVTFSFPKVESGLAVTCTLTHELGHSESITLPGPLDTSGSKNPLQQVKSTVTYLRKATFEAILGIASGDSKSDDDGNGSVDNYITEDQAIEINDLLQETGSNVKIFLKVAQAESVETIRADKYQMLINQLNVKKSKMREPGE